MNTTDNFGVCCVECGTPILLDKTNHEMTDDGKYRVTCRNFRCPQPVNEYDPLKVDSF